MRGCIYLYQLLNVFWGGVYICVCLCSPHSSRGEPGSVLRMTCPDSAMSDRLEFLIRPYQCVCVSLRSLHGSCHCIEQRFEYTDIQRNTRCCFYTLLLTSQAAKRKRRKQRKQTRPHKSHTQTNKCLCTFSLHIKWMHVHEHKIAHS